MKFTLATFAAVSAFLPTISAHLIMHTPQQWYVPEIIRETVELSDGQQSPLQADGSNYPCHGVAPEGPVATYTPGQMANLQLQGSAVHGGGSGQMSITYDTKPTKSSIFRVMTSWMGDHPIKAAANLEPNPELLLPMLTFKIPEGLPAGNAVVAWTWFNRLGNREMYMKCATVKILGSETSTAVFESLPEMFRANSGNGCVVTDDIQAIAFKNTGPQIFGVGITPIACDNTKPGTPIGDAVVSAISSVTSALATPTAVTSAPATATPTTIATKTKTQNLIAVPTSTTAYYTPTTKVGKPIKTPTPNTPATPTPGAQCIEGTVTCNSDNTWSLCGSGTNQNMGKVAGGMQCVNGEMSALNARSVRFSHEHRRRHHH